MNILITGASGFLGLNLVNSMAKKYRLFLVDIVRAEDYSVSDKYYNFYICDVRDKERIRKIFEENYFDCVIHAAAALPLWNRKDIYSTNIYGTLNVIELSKEYKVGKFIFISSTAVYGIPNVHPIKEGYKLNGVGAYGKSKVVAERICERYRKNMIVTILRPKTFIGNARLGVFEIFFDWIYEGKRIPMLGNGNNKYQLLDVDDLVDVIEIVCKDDNERLNDTFNVGAKKFGSVRESIEALCEYAGTGSKPIPLPSIPIKLVLSFFEKIKLSPLYKWVYETLDKESYVSTEKIESVLGWEARFSNNDMLIKAYKWYVKNREKVKGNVGVTHRVAWDQGILKLFKKFL